MSKNSKNRRKQNNRTTTIGFVALGCPKSLVDAESMLGTLAQAGLTLTYDTDTADAVIINTCGFIQPAVDEALDTIQEIADRKKQNRKKQKIIVTGCLAQRMGRKLFEKISEIDAVVGLNDRDTIDLVVREMTVGKRAPAAGCLYMSDQVLVPDDTSRLLITPAHSPYLRISEGCDRGCAFCTIPSIRGPFRSKPMQAVLDEARELADHGAVELNLIAQDTTRYGADLDITDGLARLLEQLETIETIRWIRVMYQNPSGISQRIIDTFANSKIIVPYIDMPIQHASTKILRSMRRPDTAESLESLIDKLHARIDKLSLRSTVIVGYPGETEQEFNQLLEAVKRWRFEALGAFSYYAEEGTPAAELPDQVDENTRRERLDAIMLTQQKIAFEKNEGMKGSQTTLLVDSVQDNAVFGRHPGQAPEIDSRCVMPKVPKPRPRPGDLIPVNVTGWEDYDLIVEKIV